MAQRILILAISSLFVQVALALTLNDIHSYRHADDDGDTLRQALNVIQRRRRMYDVRSRIRDRASLPAAASSFSKRMPLLKRQMEEVGDLPYIPDSNEEDIILPLVSASGGPSGHAYSAIISGKLSKLLRDMENRVEEKRGLSKMEESREDQDERVTAAVVNSAKTNRHNNDVEQGQHHDKTDSDDDRRKKRSQKRNRFAEPDSYRTTRSSPLTKVMPFASLYPDIKPSIDKRSSSAENERTSAESDSATTVEDLKPKTVEDIDQEIDRTGASFFHQLHADKKEVVEIRQPEGDNSENESVQDFIRQVQELPPTKYFNYASGLEHHSTFWDPSYDSMKLPSGYGEDVEKRKRKRKSGRRVLKDEDYPTDSEDFDTLDMQLEESMSREEPVAVKDADILAEKRLLPTIRRRKSVGFDKQSGRSFRQNEQKAVLGELTDILKDDESETSAKRSIKKRENKRIPPDVKREQNMSNESSRPDTTPAVKEELQDDTEDLVADNDLDKVSFSRPLESKVPSKGGDWKSDRKHFDEWLRKEYYTNLARSMINMKRRKRDWSAVRGDEMQMESSTHKKKRMTKRSSDFLDDKRWGNLFTGEGENRERQYQDVHEKLKNIEDALILEALEIVKEEAQTGMRSEADRQKLSNRLDAAYDLESMRLALEDLQETMNKMEKESELYGEVQEKPNDEAELRRYLEENGYLDKKRSGTKRMAEPNNNHPVMISIPPEELNALETELSEGDDCPALELLTSDCSALTDVVPDGRLQRLFLQACNWHEVCYTCGEAFGLTSSDCDVGFLAQSHTVCQEDAPCETTARLLLSPLRQRRVFYKRSIPDVCYRYSCVQEFLHLR